MALPPTNQSYCPHCYLDYTPADVQCRRSGAARVTTAARVQTAASENARWKIIGGAVLLAVGVGDHRDQRR